jgi:Heavy metal binding domain
VGEADQTPQGPDAEKPPLSRSLIVAFRVVLLLLAAGAAVAAVAIGLAGRQSDDAGAARYVCPMHPEVRAAAPGECPICRMALEPAVRAPAAGDTHHGDMAGMPDITAVENIRKHRILDFLRRRSLPVNIRELRGPALVGGDRALEAIFYNDQIAALSADEAATFSLTRSPRTTFAVHRTRDAVVPWDRSTSRVRFRLDAGVPASASAAAAAALSPGQAGWIEVERKVRDVLTVPASAILQSPEGPYVLAWAGAGRFEKRPIEIGETFLKQGFAVVLSGLQLHDRVVSRAAFFLDADRRLGGRDVRPGGQDPKTDQKDDSKADMPGAP